MPDFSFREWFCSRWPPKPSQRYSIYFTVLKYRTFYTKKIQFSAANFIFFISLGHDADWISTSPRTVFEINNMYICMNKRIVPIHPKVFFCWTHLQFVCFFKNEHGEKFSDFKFICTDPDFGHNKYFGRCSTYLDKTLQKYRTNISKPICQL